MSHTHANAEWVETLAARLEDERELRAWLDRWVLIPGKPWQRAMAHGLEHAASCAICLGDQTPQGWFEKEIDKAMNRQANDAEFRVIPLLLPGADGNLTETLRSSFVELNTWVDFRADEDHAFHLLTCGVTGTAPGRWTPPGSGPPVNPQTEEKLRVLQALWRKKLVEDSIFIEMQRKILERSLDS